MAFGSSALRFIAYYRRSLNQSFQICREELGHQGTAVIDIEPDRRSDSFILTPSYSFDPDAREFTRQIKHLVNSGVMQCLFAASEGASFRVERAREPRLKLFIAYEISMPFAEKYLQKNVQSTC